MKPNFVPRKFTPDPNVIHTHSIVSHRTKRGVVVLEWNKEYAQFDPEDARAFAHTILREADNAETDSFLYHHFKEFLDEMQLAILISRFREERAKLEQLSGFRKSTDELPEEDRR